MTQSEPAQTEAQTGASPQAHLRRWWPALIGILVGLVAVGVLALRPTGYEDPHSAALAAAEPHAEPETPLVLAERTLGEGRIILVAFTDREDASRLGIAFTVDRGRGWRAAGWTHEEAALDDVVVGSLLLASAEGNGDQPAWSAVCGELGEDRITSVEVEWSDGETSRVDREDNAYFAVREGVDTPESVRYLDDEDEEIAVVPVGEAEETTDDTPGEGEDTPAEGD